MTVATRAGTTGVRYSTADPTPCLVPFGAAGRGSGDRNARLETGGHGPRGSPSGSGETVGFYARQARAGP